MKTNKKILCCILLFSMFIFISKAIYSLDEYSRQSEIAENKDMALFLNGKLPSEEILLYPKDSLIFELSVKKGTFIKDISVESENSIIKEIIKDKIKDFRSKQYDNDSKETVTATLPSVVPAGVHTITINIKYLDNQRSEKSFYEKIDLNIESNSITNKIVGFLSGIVSDEAAAELVDKFSERTIDPLQIEPTDEELRSLESIGLTDEDIKNKDYDLKKIDTVSLTEKLSDKDIDNLIEQTKDPEIKAALELLKSMDMPNVEKQLDVYEIKKGNKTVYMSKVIIKISYKNSINNLHVIEIIPKSTAEHVSMITFSEYPNILEDDPIVKWNFDHVPKDQVKEYSYTVDKKLDDIESKTIAAGNNPGFFTKLIAWLIGMFS